MVAQHYRWDFVGLSTDTKPTPETSEKVVDGSTFYCSDTSKLYVFCKDTWYERKALGGGGGGGTTYTAGDGIDITDDTISVDTDTIQEKLTAGTGIDITDNTISATGGGGDTVYSDKSTSNSSSGGAVYIGNLNSSQEEQADPTTTDYHYKYFWALPHDNNIVPHNSSINILGTTESSYAVSIGENSVTRLDGQVSLGYGSLNNYSAIEGVALGYDARNQAASSVALGARSRATRAGEVNIGNNSGEGYNNTVYRVLGGVHDGQLANDAVTVGQVNAVIDAINSALNTSIPHIGS
jgi:hypothetical protein